MLDAIGQITRERAVRGSIVPLFRPFIDGDVVQEWMDDPETSPERAHCREIVIGFTREEMAAFFWQQAQAIDNDARMVLDWYQSAFGAGASAAYWQAASHRARATPYTQWVDGHSNRQFVHYTLATASAYAKQGTAFVYRFDLQSEQPYLFAPHCIDLPFFFNNLGEWHDAPMLRGSALEPLQALASRFSNCMIDFVRTGSPGKDDWHRFAEVSTLVLFRSTKTEAEYIACHPSTAL